MQEELQKYQFHFEHFQNHQKAQILAQEQVISLQEQIQMLNVLHNIQIGSLKFLEEAQKQVIKCRRILKYTYVYGFYMKQESDQFLFYQADLEKFTDRLHEQLEKDFKKYQDQDKIDINEFYGFKRELTNNYDVYFNQLCEVMEEIDFVVQKETKVVQKLVRFTVKIQYAETFQAELSENDKIENLKLQILESFGLPPSMQQIQFNSQTLDDSITIKKAGITNKSQLNCLYDF